MSSCPFPDVDEEPWQPSEGFDEVFVRINEKGECVVSGPKEKVAQVKAEILGYLSKGQEKGLPETIQKIELEKSV